MAPTEAQISDMLKGLETLLKQIEPLRRRVAEIEQGLAETQRQYDPKLGRANAEAERLEGLKRSLLARLDRKEEPPPPPPPPPPGVDPIPPPRLVEIKPEPGMTAPEPPPESQRIRRKRALLDFIFNFTDTGPVIERINALLGDESRDLGDVLELLTWGDIWKARTQWETPEEQWQRLSEWRTALEGRMAYWQEESRRLEGNDYYELWVRRSELSDEAWNSFLDGLLRGQEADNERLTREVAELEARWQAVRQNATEVNHG